jgi:D-alanyl-D-alanine carboxypeptidase
MLGLGPERECSIGFPKKQEGETDVEKNMKVKFSCDVLRSGVGLAPRLGGVAVLVLFLLFVPTSISEKEEVLPALTGAGGAFREAPVEISVSKYPRKMGKEAAPEISAAAAIVTDWESGTVLYESNAKAKMYPASLAKLMTAIVALDYFSPDAVIQIGRLANGRGEAEMGLAAGDRVTVKSLLAGLLISSGNDAAYALATGYPGGTENFIYAMNKKAENLGMEDTHFANPTGLDSPFQFSTARDIAILSRVALGNDLIASIVATSGMTVTDITGKKAYSLKNINKFLDYLYGADGIKTGFTDLAGENLAASVSRSGHRIIAVVLKSQNRFSDNARLVEWAYRNFTWVEVAPP